MKKTCIIVSKLEKINFDIGKEAVLYIEDYVQISNVSDARNLTDKIFSYNTDFIQEYDHKGYKVTWSWYSDIFQFCIKYLEIKALLDKINGLNINKIIVGEINPQYKKVINVYFFDKNVTLSRFERKLSLDLKQILFNFVMLIYSLVSILFFTLRPGKNIGTYTGDFIYKGTKSDFRLNHLYEKYDQNSIQYIEFIRNTKMKDFFVNIFKRKRFAIYYTAVIFFVDLFTRKTKYIKQPKNFYQSLIYGFHDANIVLKRSIIIIEKILKILRIDKFVLISFSSRSAHLAIAAKSLEIKTIGIMHGLSQKEYATQEFMESYIEEKYIGCDVYGVWSRHYLKYFKEFSKISDKDSFQFSGLLRPIKNIRKADSFEKNSQNKIKVLLISEPLVAVSEIIPYLKYLMKDNKIEVCLKVRPMIQDIYYENMKLEFPEIKNLKIYDGKLEDIAYDFDVFIGSNSTAVIEASLFGKISVLLKTIKFGDYFEIDELTHKHHLLVKDPEFLCKEIQYRVENENELKTIEKTKIRFFGENKDGAQWVMEQL
ncbi:hypothetical protein OAO97_00975 [Candidatus Pseudothioglobus singularis]|nr:hypothetical protein [Candidatus Pseudothioglobus singularis]